MKDVITLNGYAGLGGNRQSWPKNVKVTAVEINPEVAAVYKENFPEDEVIIGDAHEYLLKHYFEFDFIWLSPPCQTHSKMNKATRHNTIRYADMKLYQEIILLQHFFKGKWVVENVDGYYDPLIKPRSLARHYFWSNFYLSDFRMDSPPNFTRATKEVMLKWLGLKCEPNIYLDGNHDPAQVLRNCVHPSLGKHIIECALQSKQSKINKYMDGN